MDYILTHRLFQRLRRDFPTIFHVRLHAQCPNLAIISAQYAVCECINSAVLVKGTGKLCFQDA